MWAGFETTVHLISNGIATVLSEPGPVKLVREEAGPHTPRMAALVEELLRRDGPMLTAIRRFPLEDIKVGDRIVPAGETVLLAIGSANRDPQTSATPTPSTSTVPAADTSASATDPTTASAHRSPAWKYEPRCGRQSIGFRISNLPFLRKSCPGSRTTASTL